MTAPNEQESKWSDYSKYLKGPHLDGRRVVVTIAAITFEKVHVKGKTCTCPIAYFEGKKAGLPLSLTNQTTLCRLFGNNIKKAVGQRIAIQVVPMQVGGEERDPIRIFPAPPKPDDPAAEAVPHSS